MTRSDLDPQEKIIRFEDNYDGGKHLVIFESAPNLADIGINRMELGAVGVDMAPPEVIELITNTNGNQVWFANPARNENYTGPSIGEDLLFEGEKHLLSIYGKTFRYVRDSTRNGWTSRHLGNVITKIREEGHTVTILWTGEIRLRPVWIYEIE